MKVTVNFDSTLAGLQAQLDRAEELKRELADHIAFAKRYLKDSPDGTKLTRGKNGERSKILSPSGRNITPDEIKENIPAFSNSIIKHDGDFYVLLNNTLFSSDNNGNPRRGLRRGKLAMNQRGELFYAKIVANTEPGTQYYLDHEATSEMSLMHELGGAPSSKVPVRKMDKADASNAGIIKSYLFIPFRGIPAADLIESNQLSALQMAKLALGFIRSTLDFNEQHLIHRDIKPQNFAVTIDDNGDPIPSLIDFGYVQKAILDKKSKEWSCKTRHFSGTKDFLPPTFWAMHKALEVRKQSKHYQHNAERDDYLYNLSTDLYAAAISALDVVNYLEKFNQIDELRAYLPEDFSECEDLIQKIKIFAEKIKETKVYQQKYSANLKPIKITDTGIETIKRRVAELEVLHQEMRETQYANAQLPTDAVALEISEQPAKTVFKRAVSVKADAAENEPSPLESPTAVALFDYDNTNSIARDFKEKPEVKIISPAASSPSIEKIKQQILERIRDYKLHINNTEQVHNESHHDTLFSVIPRKKQSNLEFLAMAELNAGIKKSTNNANILAALRKYKNEKEDHSPVLLNSLYTLLSDAESEDEYTHVHSETIDSNKNEVIPIELCHHQN